MVKILYVANPEEVEHFWEFSSSEGIPPGTHITCTTCIEEALKKMDSETRSGEKYNMMVLSEIGQDQSIRLTREGKRKGLNVVILDGNDPAMRKIGREAGADRVFSRYSEQQRLVDYITGVADQQDDSSQTD